jgi:hypothetical protein
MLAGVFAVALGVVHVWVPRIWAFDRAIGVDGAGLPPFGVIRFGRFAYERRRSDLMGLAWVMSNAASYVLVTIGIIDLAWVLGDRTIPLPLGATWIAGWWALRGFGQFALGRRSGDLGMAALFIALAAWHVMLAAGIGAQ